MNELRQIVEQLEHDTITLIVAYEERTQALTSALLTALHELKKCKADNEIIEECIRAIKGE